ncbi:MAG: ASCH domain-containing protein [Ornithinimicrobium sp.]
MDQQEIDAFWRDASIRGRLNPAGAYLGRTVDEALPPPAWSFGRDPAEADLLLGLVLNGTKTATSSARSEYADDDDLPTAGMLSILLDGGEHPRALIRITDVAVVPFDAVDADHAAAEGEGDRSLDYWRAAHRDFFSDGEAPFDPLMEVVLERFVVLAAREVGSRATANL